MKPENEEKVTGLLENAYRELKEGESYKPLMSPNKHYPEVTLWSVLWGLVMAVIFSAAAAYLGLKVGQVFEAAIPIAIIAVGLSSGGHFHLARPLYPARQISGDHGQFLRGFHEFLVRRYHRDLAINPVP